MAIVCGSVRVTLCPCTKRVRSGDFPPTADFKDNAPSLPVGTISKGYIVAIICGSVRVTLCPCTDRVRSGDFPPTADVKDNIPSLPVGTISKVT